MSESSTTRIRQIIPAERGHWAAFYAVERVDTVDGEGKSARYRTDRTKIESVRPVLAWALCSVDFDDESEGLDMVYPLAPADDGLELPGDSANYAGMVEAIDEDDAMVSAARLTTKPRDV